MEHIYIKIHSNTRKIIAICTLDFLISHTNIPVFQRSEDENHTQDISKKYIYDYEKYHDILFIGQISLGKYNEEYYIWDGQHRIAAMKLLKECYPETSELKVDVCIYEVPADYPKDFDYTIYRLINSNKQMPFPTTQKSSENTRIITDYMKKNYKDYIKSSGIPRCPHFNIEKFEKELKKRCIYEKIDAKDFIGAMEKLNDYYKKRFDEEHHEWGWDSGEYERIYDRFRFKKNIFYPTIYRNYEWLDRICLYFFNKILYENMSHTRNEKLKKIPVSKKIREKVWKKRNGDTLDGKCFVCEESLNYNDAECAHVIARCLGGNFSVENLEPTCRSCNGSMGTRNLYDYKREVHG